MGEVKKIKYILFVALSLIANITFSQIKVYSDYCVSPSKKINSLVSIYIDSLLNEQDISKFWVEEDYKIWGSSSISDIPIHAFRNYTDLYTVSVLGIINLDSDDRYKVTLGFFYNADSINNVLFFVYNIVANYNGINNTIKFSNYTNEFLKNWYSIKVGRIQYFRENESKFNRMEAAEMNSANDSLARFFKLKPIENIVYLSCSSPFQLFNLKGFDYIQNMFYAKTGAIANLGYKGGKFENIIYSGNNKDIYVHELVHFYIQKLIMSDTETTQFANEGIATFLAGSSDEQLSSHLSDLNKHLKNNHIKIVPLIGDNQDRMVNEIQNLYLVGGLFAKLVYEKRGLDGLLELLNVSEKNLEQKLSQLLEVPKDNLEKVFYKELSKY